MLQHLGPTWLQKISPRDSEIIPVTIYELYSQNYLKVSYSQLNSLTKSKKFFNVLAIAIFNFIRNNLKKIENNNFYCFFDTLTMPVSVSISHSNFSPLDSARKSLANAGMVVVKEPATDCIFVSYFIFIPHIYLIHYINTYIYLFTNIYNYLYYLLYRNLYILIKS